MAEEIFLKDVYAEEKEMLYQLHLELIRPQRPRCNATRQTLPQSMFRNIFEGGLYSVLGFYSLKTLFDDSNFVPNRLLMLHSTRAVTLSREDFKVKVEQTDNINKIENFCSQVLTCYDMWIVEAFKRI